MLANRSAFGNWRLQLHCTCARPRLDWRVRLITGQGMLRAAARILVSLWLLAFAGQAAFAEKRVALVIGNGNYTYAGTLANPVNDASDMAAALKAVGFKVVSGYDLQKAALEKKIREFASTLAGADTGVFFYAGHGLQVAGTNYIVPVDAALSTADALEFEMVKLDLVQRIMENAANTNILFLDACRNNPLARNLARALGTRGSTIGRGLAPAESGIGTLISFSTQPGNVAQDGSGRNSPFTGPLVKRIATPGEDILTVLTAVRNEVLAATGEKQVPWENHALRAKFYFNPATPEATQPQTPLSEAAQAWAGIKDLRDIAVFDAFRRQYGVANPFYDELAARRIAELRPAFPPAAMPTFSPPSPSTPSAPPRPVPPKDKAAQQASITCTGVLTDMEMPCGDPLGTVFDDSGNFSCAVDRCGSGHDPLRPCKAGQRCQVSGTGTYVAKSKTYYIRWLTQVDKVK